MPLNDYVKKEYMEKWPWIYPIQLLDIVLEEADAIDFGPYKGVRFDALLDVLTDKIRQANGEILLAKNRDDVNAAESRIKLLTEEKEKIINGFRKNSIERLRIKFEIGYGYCDSSGVRKIIKPTDWPIANIDWEERKVVIETGRYADVRFLRYEYLPHEIQYAVNRDLRDVGEYVPYAPGEEENEYEQMEEMVNDTPDMNKSTDIEDIQLPKDKKQNKQATQERNERWRGRGKELQKLNPKIEIQDIAKQLSKEYLEETGEKIEPDSIQRLALSGLKKSTRK